jgi:glycerophosphoryl diester phosphodiesterase
MDRGRRCRPGFPSVGIVIADRLLDPAARLVIGHRGAAGSAPENTLPSFDLALAQGAAALELDVRLTADGIPVVLHDPTLDRTTSGTGPVRVRPLGALAEVDAGARFTPGGGAFPFRDGGVRIPTLRSVLERYRETPLLIELKEVDAQGPVREALVRAGAERRALIAAFDPRALAAFQEPPFLVGASRRDIVALKVASAFGLRPAGRGVRAYAVPYRYRGRILVPSPAFIRAAHRLEAPVHVWTVDDPRLARDLWRSGVSGIVTNHPATIVQALGEVGPSR